MTSKITKESLIENLRLHKVREDADYDACYNDVLLLMDKATKNGTFRITLAEREYPLLGKNIEYFKNRGEEHGLSFGIKWAHPFQCDCDLKEPCTKYHVIAVALFDNQ